VQGDFGSRGVDRVVLTSSFVAIGYGQKPRTAPFDERDWTDLNGPGLTAYAKSKTLAEHAAWDFIASEGNDLELSVINPAGIFGPPSAPTTPPPSTSCSGSSMEASLFAHGLEAMV